MFKQLTGQSAVLRKSGVYRTCDLYEFKGMLFAKFGSGFVRMNSNGSSSLDGLQLDHLAYDGELYQDRFGRLAVAKGEGYKTLMAQPDGTLLQLEDKA